MKYKKKNQSVIVEAIQWKNNYNQIEEFLPKNLVIIITREFRLRTLEGKHIASEGDWIIKDAKGEISSCSPDIFERTYEKVED